MLAPQRMTDPARVAEQFRPYIGQAGKPLFASWMGGKEVEEGKAILGSYGIPTFAYPERAVRAFNYMWRYTYHLHGLYETPAVADDPTVATGADRGLARCLIPCWNEAVLFLQNLKRKRF